MIIALGLNHKTAPLAIREQLAVDTSMRAAMLEALKRRFASAEFVLLSTCNRVELYCACAAGEGPSADMLTQMLGHARGMAHASFQPYLYVHRNEEAVRHLLTVAASLDSMVVGETEILGQVKESYATALKAGSTGRILNRLFHLAVATGKKVHTQTALASSRTSVPGVAVDLMARLVPRSGESRMLVVGAGEMGERFVKLLQERGFTQITIVNRTNDKGAELAARCGVVAAPWERLCDELISCDAVLSCTASTEHIVGKAQMSGVMSRRSGDIIIVDIGVPRDFEPGIAELPGVRLFSIDELSPAACDGTVPGADQIARSFDIVYSTAAEFMKWYALRDIGPLIGTMQERFRHVVEAELRRTLASHLEPSAMGEFDVIVSRIAGKLSHAVIQHVDAVSHEHGPELAADFLRKVVARAEDVYADPECMEDFVK